MMLNHSLLDEFEVRGNWNLPHSDRRVPGALKFSPERGIGLSLDRPLESGIAGIKSLMEPKRNLYDVVQGHGLDGNSYTLFGFENRGFGLLRCRLMAVGESATVESELRYDALTTEFEGLEAFVGFDPITGQLGEGSATIVYAEPKPMTVKLDETYCLSMQHWHASSTSFGRWSLEHRASIRFGSTEARSVEEFFKGPVASFQRMLELAAGRRLRLKSVAAKSKLRNPTPEEHGDPKPVLLFFRQRSVDASFGELLPDDLNFTLQSFGSEADKIISKWHLEYSDLWPATSFYFLLDSRFELDVGLEMHFLSSITAIEHLHRTTQATEKRGKSSSLERQLSALISQAPAPIAAVIGDSQHFFSKIIATRSNLLHGQPMTDARRLSGRELWKAINGLRLIVFTGLIGRMGLNQAQIEQAATKTVEFRRLKEYLRRPQ